MNELWLKTRLYFETFGQKDQLSEYQLHCLSVIDKPIIKAPLMAIDLEMTGLNPLQDQIISIGIVPIEPSLIPLSIPLSKAQQVMINIDGSVGQSAAVHGIIDNHLSNALSLEQAMEWFIEQTKGHILVAHHAPMDIGFLQSHLLKSHNRAIKLPYIDTLALEKQRLLRQHDVLKEGSLRLDACRQRYGLPTYSGHDALIDALACAELLVAQLNSVGDINKLSVSEFISI
ncbi:exonuclease domain-containing protein [Shewanella sp. KT0246]|uniref:3'-5' exonuclease n=1 Tax=Shewanella sp. KT0246 TaxID=2815912 RepID=UPI001BC6277B|nr:exonuclease domain-containing protein [Shewanella sp. KT0246]GIU53620.1 DNA polymerase III subunit epsilon [Shewanella sp. KT0246]